jgi:hypothetical protein
MTTAHLVWPRDAPVRINYRRAHYRHAHVETDDGGPKVKVRWYSADGPKVGRHVVAWHGQLHEQWISRERLTSPGPLSDDDTARLSAYWEGGGR